MQLVGGAVHLFGGLLPSWVKGLGFRCRVRLRRFGLGFRVVFSLG